VTNLLASAESVGLCAVDLRVERRVNPMGIDDPAPLLSWRLPPAAFGLRQLRFRIRVVIGADTQTWDPAADTAAEVWDTGMVRSTDCVDISYSGLPLEPTTVYSWAVAVDSDDGSAADNAASEDCARSDSPSGDSGRDDSGRVEKLWKWSEPTSFETGLMGKPIGGWIGAEAAPTFVDLDRAGPERDIERIWFPDGPDRSGGECFFRTSFHLPAGRPLNDARLDIGTTVETRIWINGIAVDAAGGRSLTDVLRPGSNVIAVHAVAAAAPTTSGLLAKITVSPWVSDGPALVTDGRWKVTRDPEPGWTDFEHEDSAWGLAAATGIHGVPPAGRDPVTYRPAEYLRRDFSVPAPVIRARLWATALGVYRLSINGAFVGPDLLAPGWVDVRFRLPYQSFDVTEMLTKGSNTVGAVLGDGWALGNICWFGQNQYASRRAFAATMEITCADGSVHTLATDTDWDWSHGPIRYADLQNGETFDAGLTDDGWNRPGHSESGWAPAVIVPASVGPLEAQVSPPITIQHDVPARSVTRRGSDRFIVDFGQNLVGWVRLAVKARAGTRVLLRFAEVLDADGELYTDALRTARATDEYITAGNEHGEVFEPIFTVHGFRFCEVTGLAALAVDDLSAKVAHAAMEAIGDFACSDERLNQLQHNIRWSLKGNFLTVPTDCPQRDERLGWTGDAQVFAGTAAFNYDVRSFFRKWMRDVRDAIGPDGAVPHVAPDVLSREVGTPQVGAAGWGDAIALVPLQLFRAYGDVRLVTENLDAAANWLEYLWRNSDRGVRPADGFGDWLALEATATDLVATAYFAICVRACIEMGEAVDDRRTEHWRRRYDAIRRAFRERYVRGGGRLTSNTQTAYVLALHAELFLPDEQPAAVENLVASIARRNWHLATGFLGTPQLLPVLAAHGRGDVALRLLTTDSYPSWLFPVVHGDATTMWERWDSWSPSGGFQDPAMTSFNHYAYGAVGAFLYRTVGGLEPVEPGYRKSRVRPLPGGGLTWARTRLHTPYGLLASEWQLDGDQIQVLATIPPNTTAEIVVPDGTVTVVGSGVHRVRGSV